MLRSATPAVAFAALICSGVVSMVNAADQAATQQAMKAADMWLRLVDEGKYHES